MELMRGPYVGVAVVVGAIAVRVVVGVVVGRPRAIVTGAIMIALISCIGPW
jgi:hypothetical protein